MTKANEKGRQGAAKKRKRVPAHRKKNNTWWNLDGFRYAHRGLFHQPLSASSYPLNEQSTPIWKMELIRWKRKGEPVIPENSLCAFTMAILNHFGSELDVHLTKDGKPVIIHDSDLLRMTGRPGYVENCTREELEQYRLLETEQKIPDLEEVVSFYVSPLAATRRKRLEPGIRPAFLPRRENAREKALAMAERLEKKREEFLRLHGHEKGKNPGRRPSGTLYLPLIIELKATEESYKTIGPKVMEVLDRYPDLNYCIESFDPRVVLWFKKHRPDVIRGQLTENFTKSKPAVRDWGRLMTFGMWCVATDLHTHPDFIACKYEDRNNLMIRLSYLLGVRQVSWVLRNQADLNKVEKEGGIGIFERFIPK